MKFSIITVSYNSKQTIERTIKSVLGQSFQDYEYIIVDGASKDGTIDVVKKYDSAFNGKLKWISEPDKGIYDAMNKGINMSRGEIIGIVNSDDWLELDALKAVSDVSNSIKNDEVVYTGDILYHYENGSKQNIRYTQKDLEHYAREYRMGVNHPATFVPITIYKKYGSFDQNIRLWADVDFVCRIFHRGIHFLFVEQILSNQADGGASQSNRSQVLKDYKYILNKNLANERKRKYLYFKYWILCYFKAFLPKFVLKMHRD